MKKCGKCKEIKDEVNFYKNKAHKDGLTNYCKCCHNKTNKDNLKPEKVRQYANKYRLSEKGKQYYNGQRIKEEYKQYHSEYFKDWRKSIKGKESRNITQKLMRKIYPEKAKARYAIKYNLSRGYIEKPKECSICNKQTRIESHHYDYTKPLDVIWICRKCHFEIHKNKGA